MSWFNALLGTVFIFVLCFVGMFLALATVSFLCVLLILTILFDIDYILSSSLLSPNLTYFCLTPFLMNTIVVLMIGGSALFYKLHTLFDNIDFSITSL